MKGGRLKGLGVELDSKGQEIKPAVGAGEQSRQTGSHPLSVCRSHNQVSQKMHALQKV